MLHPAVALKTSQTAAPVVGVPRSEVIAESVRRYGVFVALGITLIFGIVAVPNFATLANLDAVLRQVAVLGIVSLGQTFVILTAGIDLSVGMLIGLVTVLSNGVMAGDPTLIPAVAVLALVIGVIVGLANGAGVVIFRVHPLIVTLAMMSVLQGVIFLYTDRTVGAAPPEFRELAYGSIGPLPTSIVLLAILTAASWVVLRQTPLGRYIYAVGSDSRSARRAGIGVGRVTAAAYVICGALAGIAGLVLAARLGSGYTGAGAGFELDSIVAVVLGGTALSGGRGGVLGTVAGVVLLALIANMLNLLGISPFTQRVVNGLIIIAAIAIYTARRRES
jgi:ribose/xylose/arabinose/galactoside ABC-type transport system permease subunit